MKSRDNRGNCDGDGGTESRLARMGNRLGMSGPECCGDGKRALAKQEGDEEGDALVSLWTTSAFLVMWLASPSLTTLGESYQTKVTSMKAGSYGLHPHGG